MSWSGERILQYSINSLSLFRLTNKNDTFITIKRSKQTKWIIPKRDADTSSILAEWSPQRLLPKIAWTIIVNIHRVGFLHLTGCDNIYFCEENAATNNSAAEGTLLGIYVGAESPSQKLTVFLRINCKIVVVKLPLGTDSACSIASEEAALTKLRSRSVTSVPKVMSTLEDNGLFIQTWMGGTPCNRTITQSQCDFIKLLQKDAPKKTHKQFYDDLVAKIQTKEPELFKQYASKIENVSSSINNTLQMSIGPVHGDFAPWNMKILSDSSLFVFDWESYDDCGYEFFDLMYFQLACDFYLSKLNPSTEHISRYCQRSLALLGHQNKPIEGCEYVFAIYLAYLYDFDEKKSPLVSELIKLVFRDDDRC